MRKQYTNDVTVNLNFNVLERKIRNIVIVKIGLPRTRCLEFAK